MANADTPDTDDLAELRLLREKQRLLDEKRRAYQALSSEDRAKAVALLPVSAPEALRTAVRPQLTAYSQELLSRVTEASHRQLAAPEWATRAAEGAAQSEARAKEYELTPEDRLLRAARARGLPEHPKLRRVALCPRPPRTAALRAVQHARRWSVQHGAHDSTAPYLLVLLGGFGTGKSAAMGWAVVWEPKQGPTPALFVPASKIGGTPRNTFSTNEALWEQWLTVPLLGIDELGIERALLDTAAATATFGIAQLLHERHTHGRRTIVTCNMDMEQFTLLYGTARLFDRIIRDQEASGLPWLVECKGDSLRDPGLCEALWATVGG